MATTYTFFETQIFQEAAEIVKPDGCIRGTAQDSPKRLVRSHSRLLPIAARQRGRRAQHASGIESILQAKRGVPRRSARVETRPPEQWNE